MVSRHGYTLYFVHLVEYLFCSQFQHVLELSSLLSTRDSAADLQGLSWKRGTQISRRTADPCREGQCGLPCCAVLAPASAQPGRQWPEQVPLLAVPVSGCSVSRGLTGPGGRRGSRTRLAHLAEVATAGPTPVR